MRSSICGVLYAELFILKDNILYLKNALVKGVTWLQQYVSKVTKQLLKLLSI